ncbi:MAG: anthranilate phosphoribosyltransferase [Planctomycetota bacterium]|nr:anthranilate phosphoribosyltransferase [Planctomycetota bacterium]
MQEISYSDLLRAVMARQNLTLDQANWAFGQIMGGAWTEAQIAGLLVALAAKGETVDEIAGAAEAMRLCVQRIDTGGAEVIDTCGTGGTGLRTFNISTAAALVCAGAGVKVAKHGNRTSTRPSGSADVLAVLGVNIEADADCVARCLAEAGVCFCFAVRCHPAMKHAAPVRKALGVRTIFNILGPLTNPAGATRQLLGVFDYRLIETIANVLNALGSVRAMVVCAEDGLDELSSSSVTRVSELIDGQVRSRTVQPEDFGLRRSSLKDLLVDSPDDSAAVIRGVLAGNPGPARDVVLLNAAAALCVAGRAESIAAAVPLAAQAIDSGAADAALQKLIDVSNT